MQHPRSVRAHQEGWFFHRVVADRDDQIGALDRIMDIVALRKRGGAHIEARPAGDGAFAHLGVEEWDLQAPDEIRQGVGKARTARGRAQHDERALRAKDHFGRAVQRRARGYRQRDRVARHRRNLGRLICRDVLRQFEMDGPWSLLLRDPESLPHDRGDGRRAYDLTGHLGQGRHRRDDVHDLEARLLAAQNALLARDHDHGHGAEQRIGRAGRQIECARTKRRQANAGFAGQPAVRRRHEGRRLFVAGHHQLDRRAAQRFDEIEVLLSGNPEDLLHAFVFQRGHQQLGTIHRVSLPQLGPSGRSLLPRARCFG